jgi:hypothetical protein
VGVNASIRAPRVTAVYSFMRSFGRPVPRVVFQRIVFSYGDTHGPVELGRVKLGWSPCFIPYSPEGDRTVLLFLCCQLETSLAIGRFGCPVLFRRLTQALRYTWRDNCTRVSSKDCSVVKWWSSTLRLITLVHWHQLHSHMSIKDAVCALLGARLQDERPHISCLGMSHVCFRYPKPTHH